MPTIWTGPCFVDKAFAAAPVPRPPQPTSAIEMREVSPAYRPDRPMPRLEATAIPPDVLITSRRVGAVFSLFIMILSWRGKAVERRVVSIAVGMWELSPPYRQQARGQSELYVSSNH